MLRQSIIIIAILAAVLMAGCGEPAQDETATEVARNVRVMPLETSPVTQYLELAGPVVPVRGAEVSSEESGTVATIARDKGAEVGDRDVILTLDRRLLRAELDAARAQVELREYSHERTRQLREAGKVSELELLESAAELAAARSQRDVARTRHDRSAVKAPFAGIVVDRYVEPGELVGAGTPIARVIDPYVLKLEGALTEQDVTWVQAGMTASVQVDGVEQPVEGTVAWVGFEAGPTTGKFPVEVHVPNDDLNLRSGAIGRARVAKGAATGMVVVPRDAVMPGDGVDHVFVVEGNRARKRLVHLGPGQGLMVAVRDGLGAGDQLVVRGQRDLRDGSLVNVTERVAYGDGTVDGDPDVIRSTSAGTRVAEEAVR